MPHDTPSPAITRRVIKLTPPGLNVPIELVLDDIEVRDALLSPSQEGRSGEMNSDDDPEVLQTVLRAAALEETESYLVRGRRFERLSKEDLSERWIAGFKAWCRNHTLELQREFDDTAAELMLRGEEPPFDAVRDETAALADEAARDVSTRGGANRARLRARIRELLTQGRGRPTQ